MKNDLIKVDDIIAEISMGPFGSDIKVENFVSSGIPVLNGSNLTSYKLVEDSFKYVTLEKASTFRKAIAHRGDIVVTHRGTLGQISYIPDDSLYDSYVISQSQFRVKLNDDVDPAYIVYYFHTSEGQKRLLSFKNHVGVPALAQATTNFRKLEIPLPDFKTQQKIAKFLKCIDKKIDINNKRHDQLEKLAKTIYDYWFIQYDFLNKNGKPYKTSGGKMKWNDEMKRQIPEDWHVKELSEVTTFINRGISPIYLEKGGISVLNQKCIRSKKINFLFSRRHNNALKNVSSKYINIGDILVNSTGFGTLGRVALVKRLEEENTTVDSHITIIRPNNEKVNTHYLGYSLLDKQSEIESLAEGSTGQTELSRVNLEHLKIIVPTMDLQLSFDKLINPVLNSLAAIEVDNKNLINLRDWMLPLFMNGQVKVLDN